jgi:hypothetical protein
MKILLIITLLVITPASFAQGDWFTLAKNQFEQESSENHSQVCIEEKTYNFRETEQKEGEFQLKYTVIDYHPKPINNYGTYKKIIGYFGECSNESSKYETVKTKDSSNSIIKNKITELVQYTSKRDDEVSKSITNGEVEISANFEIKRTLLPSNEIIEDRCLNLFTSNHVDAMHFERYLITGKTKEKLSGTNELVVRYSCDCDGGPNTNCPETNSIGDINGDSVPEIIEYYNSGEGDCVRILEIEGNKLNKVFKGEFYNGPC